MVDSHNHLPQEWRDWSNQTLTKSFSVVLGTWLAELKEDSLNVELTVEKVALMRGKILAVKEIITHIEEMRKEPV
jgi:hypothetical protein